MSNPDQSNIQLEPTEEVFVGPVRGNSSRKHRLFQDSEITDETPLPKRERKTPQKLQ